MSTLSQELIKDLLFEEENKKTIGIYAGGFKPPTKGHFEVLEKALKENPEIDEMLVYIGKKDRGTISQKESKQIWDIYSKYLPFKVQYIESTVPPIKAVYNYAKENPTKEVLWILGAREESKDDFIDISNRTKSITKYPNLELRTIITTGGVSGTAARNALEVSKEDFEKFLPEKLSNEDKDKIWVMLTNFVTESQSSKFDRVEYYKNYISNLIPSEMKVEKNGEEIIISNIINNSLQENKIYNLNIPKFNQPKTIQQHLIENINEINLSKENAVDINGDLTGGIFKVGDIIYEYNIKNIPNPYKDLGLFYNIQFTPKDEVTSIPKGGKENYIKIVSTMYKIIVDFIEKEKPDYIGISSLDGNKNYHTVYNTLTDNSSNLIPGYFRKDSNLKFNSPQGKGRFIVLKRKENLNENATYSSTMDYKQRIKDLTKYMLNNGMNIKPLPKVIFKHAEKSNAQDFLGKTAYYDPTNQEIVLYTEGRHPKDIVRSFSHEMIHHIQNLEGRLGNIQTTNTQEDDTLNNIEAEANLKGTMTFRNWTDSLNENVEVDQVDQLESLLNKWTTYSGQYDLLPEIARLAKNLGVNKGPSIVYRAVPGLDEYTYTKQEIIDYDIEQEIVSTSATKEQAKEFITSEADWAYILEYKPYIIINFDEFEEKYDWSGNWGEGELLIDVPKSKLLKITKVDTIKENKKNKDPFGLNQYALELGRLSEEEKEKEYQIYCDMDGVLADFELGYKNLTGIDPSSPNRPEGEEFWAPIAKAGVKFWASLKWMPGGKELWDYIKPFNPKLLSAPSREESSKIGKYVWVKNRIPGTKLLLRSAFRKKEFANPNSILIDDRIANIKSWEQAGGIGIHHTSTPNTIKELKKLGL